MKNQDQNTPGPWTYKLKVLCKGIHDNGEMIEPYTRTDYYTINAGEGFWGSAKSPKGFDIQSYMKEADARLIASAPDLLQALEDCKVTLKAFLPEAFETISKAETAIAKARGL